MIDSLRKLGLNKYESLAYEALIKGGIQSGFALSQSSGVPFGRIYDSLKALIILGLVEVVPGKPKKFKSLKVDNAINNITRERVDELERLRDELINESKKISNTNKEKESVTISEGRTAFARKLAEHLSIVENELVATAENYKVKDVYPSIKRLMSKGVKEILLGPVKGHENEVNELKKAGVKIIDYSLPGIRLLVTDKELVTISIQDKEHEVINITLKNKALGEALRKLLIDASKKSNTKP